MAKDKHLLQPPSSPASLSRSLPVAHVPVTITGWRVQLPGPCWRCGYTRLSTWPVTAHRFSALPEGVCGWEKWQMNVCWSDFKGLSTPLFEMHLQLTLMLKQRDSVAVPILSAIPSTQVIFRAVVSCTLLHSYCSPFLVFSDLCTGFPILIQLLI